jgi:3-deoxy-D-manno-octulosonic-acid transferase
MLVSKFLYGIFLFCYQFGIRLYAPFDRKAKKWLEGRKGWQKKYSNLLHPGENRIWIHCSSLGEFEQGRPLIEALKKTHSQYKIVLSFFSPSGYEIRKDYALADYVIYLPMDGKRNAALFLDLIDPSMAIFVKYEFWFYYLQRLKERLVPVILISAAFRQSQPFFQWYGLFFRKMITSFNFIFVQDEQSLQLLKGIGHIKTVQIAGDTRFDRVSDIAMSAPALPFIGKFKGMERILIAGSTWPEDERVLSACMEGFPAGWKLVIAPHEIDPSHLQAIEKLFPKSVRYSQLQEMQPGIPIVANVLVIDNIGILSALYAYGEVAYIGGGFQKSGIHNVLEPAVFGLPLVFGPAYKKFIEAAQLVSKGLAFPVSSASEALSTFQKLAGDDVLRRNIHDSLRQFVEGNKGSTDFILSKLAEGNWLKSLFLHT